MGLRRALSTKLAGIAVQAAPQQITTTVGATQALTSASPLHSPCVCCKALGNVARLSALCIPRQ